tara:strand:+ start:1362 stop:1589 length:228 start_codon:yes stop_codon:yes gene_type:complete
MDLIKVKFLKSPTGKYKMAYNAGHIGLAPKEIASELVKEGYAVLVEQTKKVETKTNTEAEKVTSTAKKRTTRKTK